MKMLLGGPVHRWRRMVRRWLADAQIRRMLLVAGSFLAGLCLSAASLGNAPQPFCLSVLCMGLPGWLPLPFALASSLGYWIFWGQAGLQGIVWVAVGLPVCMLLSQRQKTVAPLLSAMAGLIVAAVGVAFQIWQGESAAVAMYVLRIFIAAGSTWLLVLVQQRRDPMADWVAMGIGVLALAQIAPVSFLPLGYVAAAMLVLTAPFPAVAVAGMALDLSGITAIPMTAVVCLAYLVRLLTWLPRMGYLIVPTGVYLLVMALCGQVDYTPVPALLVGSFASLFAPQKPRIVQRRGEIGFAQVRLEMVSGVLAQTEQLLKEARPYPIDEGALIARAAERACGGCKFADGCEAAALARNLSPALLHRNGIEPENIPEGCNSKPRLLTELRCGQGQYRVLNADRDRQQEYRAAVVQQYGFLTEYLQDLADTLPRREDGSGAKFEPEVAVCSRGKEQANGDRCLWFAGTGCHYYVLLCDGMGTGEAAAYEAKTAGNMLRRMLIAGYPAPYALRSLNSLCVLRGSAGAVTVDLAEVDLRTGRAVLYKWGAAPSWLLLKTGAVCIGRETPPPGLSMEEIKETVDRFTLQQLAPLVLISDGVDAAAAIGALEGDFDQPPGFLATLILEAGQTDVPDDATAAVLQLKRIEGR